MFLLLLLLLTVFHPAGCCCVQNHSQQQRVRQRQRQAGHIGGALEAQQVLMQLVEVAINEQRGVKHGIACMHHVVVYVHQHARWMRRDAA